MGDISYKFSIASLGRLISLTRTRAISSGRTTSVNRTCSTCSMQSSTTFPFCCRMGQRRALMRRIRPAAHRRHSRLNGGVRLRLDATQDIIRGLSARLSLLSDVSSGYCSCELGGDGYGELTSDATRRVRYGRESRSDALSMTSLSMARPFFSSPCLEK